MWKEKKYTYTHIVLCGGKKIKGQKRQNQGVCLLAEFLADYGLDENSPQLSVTHRLLSAHRQPPIHNVQDHL